LTTSAEVVFDFSDPSLSKGDPISLVRAASAPLYAQAHARTSFMSVETLIRHCHGARVRLSILAEVSSVPKSKSICGSPMEFTCDSVNWRWRSINELGAEFTRIGGNRLAASDRQHRPENGRSKVVGQLEDMARTQKRPGTTDLAPRTSPRAIVDPEAHPVKV
jgi:hypothetical protein